MRVLYFNNCWFTNVGEAFIDIGGLFFTRQLFPDAKIACLSAMPHYYMRNASDPHRSVWKKLHVPATGDPVEMSDYLTADYVVLMGMVATREYLDAPSRKMIDHLIQGGTKLILLGIGGLYYDTSEIDHFQRYLEKITPAPVMMTRDGKAFESYQNVVPCINGLDLALWVKDTFDPRGFQIQPYDVVTYNRITEPVEFQEWSKPVIRCFHEQYGYNQSKQRSNMLISDTPLDYLTCYANADRVYTDLVHATLISLMYGKYVRFSPTDKRSYAVEAIQQLKHDGEGFISVDETSLDLQKQGVFSKTLDMVVSSL